MPIQKLVFLLFSLLFALLVEAQVPSQKIPPFRAGGRALHGFIITHNQTMERITNRSVQAQEFHIEKQTFGKQAWQNHLGYPSIGIGFSRFDFNNETFFGKAYSIIPYLNFHLIRHKLLNLDFRAGSGFGWIEEPFDPIENYKNIAIGSNVNTSFAFLLEVNWHISPRLDLSNGLSFTHFSNTAFSKPNLGINIPAAHLGIHYHWGPKNETPQKEIVPPLEKQAYQHYLLLGWGINETSSEYEKKYVGTVLNYIVERQVNHKSILGWNVDVFYNPAQRINSEAEGIRFQNELEVLQLGVGASHSLVFGKLRFFTELGFYVLNKHNHLSATYQRIGGRYTTNKRLGWHFIFKTHLSRAEYFGVGIDYRLSK